MFCRDCGAQIADDTVICPVCGAQLQEGLNTGVQMGEYPQSTQGYQPVKEKKKASKKGIAAGIIGVVVICVVAGVVGLVSLLNKKADKTPQSHGCQEPYL